MSWFGEDSEEAEAYLELTTSPPDVNLPHEIIAAAAAYEAAKAYEAHLKMQERPHSFAKAKEILAALTVILVDRIVESRGFDTIDRAKVTEDANKRNEEKLAHSYNEY
ncbi:hypothetical protein C8R47DRAFT_1323583 [Mycena vitilis]|nr:hypothetical protein C8R47DRAFT_1323583 [Mycena vitilis]